MGNDADDDDDDDDDTGSSGEQFTADEIINDEDNDNR